jgi:hypothetical protein
MSPSKKRSGKTSKRYAVGILYVHGIGQQVKGETIAEFADAIYGWIRGRILGIGAGHFHRHTTRETLEAATPKAAQTPGIHAPRPAQRQHLAFLETAHNYVPTAALAAQSLVEFPALEGEPLLASVELTEVPSSDDKAPSALALELDWTDVRGRQHISDWLLAESWWADKCLPPSIWQLLAWAPQVLPAIIASHMFSRLTDERVRSRWHLFRLKARTALYVSAAVLAAVFLMPIVYLLVAVSGAGSLLPWSWLADKAKDVRLLLTRVIGDAFIFAGSRAQRAAILGGIQRDLEWLSEHCDSVVVVGHSQGAMLAYLACRQRAPNVRTLITLGSGIGKLRALIGAINEGDPVQQFSKSLLLWANLAGVGVWLSAGLGLTGQIPGITAICAALLAGVAAVGAGLFGFGKFASDVLRVPPEDLVWDRWMQLRDISLDAMDPAEVLRFAVSGVIPGGMLWLDLIATRDPVAGRSTSERNKFVYDPAVASPEGQWPRSLSVTNSRSILLDHTSYLKNREECIASIVLECAQLDGTESAQWLAPDAPRSRGVGERFVQSAPIARARASIFARASRTKFALAVAMLAFVGFLVLRAPYDFRTIVKLLLARSWGALGLHWLDLGIAVVLVSVWVAGRSARTHSLSRLSTHVLERRNWCARRDAGGGLGLVDTTFNECGRVSRGEGVGFAVSALVPAIVLLVFQGAGELTAVIWTVVATPVVHAVALYLRLRENRVAIERCYGEQVQ